MFRIGAPQQRASENFYRNFFALLCFAACGIGAYFANPIALLLALCFGTLSRTAVKKGWRNPDFVAKHSILVRKPQAPPPADDKH